jgi:pilus assembly protein CpaE
MMTLGQHDAQITALLISPHRDLAQQFAATLAQTKAFQILADLKSYPAAQTLEIRARQLKPDVVLIDLATDLGEALQLVRFIAGITPPIQVVGLHTHSDSSVILQTLRAGATEFLYAPFELASQRDAIARLRRLCAPEAAGNNEAGHVVAFTSAKPGSGASTLATQTAFSLQRLTGKRILLADFDLTGGTIGFYLKLSHNYSVVEALQHAEHLDPTLWNSLAVHHAGLDILPSPAAPHADPIDGGRLRVLIDYVRQIYDWVILDLPTVFSQTSLMALAECERAFLVSTAELPSLHLTRKAMGLIDQLGFPKERFEVLVNRVDKRDDIGSANLERLFNSPVHASLPNDYFSLHRVVTLGQPLGAEGELGKAIERLAARLSGAGADGKKAGPGVREMRTVLSHA